MTAKEAKLSSGGSRNELLEYLEKGKMFTEELMKENERLRLRVLQVEKENMDLRAKYDPKRLIDLLEENRKLRSRMESMESRFDEIEKENSDFARRYVDVQSQNDNLLNLYVSSYQLHSTLNPSEVISVIEEIILNLIGAEQFFICMMESGCDRPVIVAGETGDGPIESNLKIDKVDPVLASVLTGGRNYFRGEAGMGDSDLHLACTPLKVNEDVVGAISISKLMNQKKDGLTAIDHELLNLLADHAATALVSSRLYSRTKRKLNTVEQFLELLKAEPAGPGGGNGRPAGTLG